MKDLENVIQKILWKDIILALFFLIMGIIFIINPTEVMSAVSYFIGIVLIINGILSILDIDDGFKFYDPLFVGVLSVVFGIIVVIYPSIFTTIVPILLGVWIIILGLVKFRFSNVLMKLKDDDWFVSFLMGVVALVCGCIMVLCPNFGALSITILIGWVLVAYSISDILNYIILKRKISDIAKIFKIK